MKYLTLKVVKIKTGDPDIDGTDGQPIYKYREQLLWAIAVNTPQEGGMDSMEQHRRLRLLDIIETAQDGDIINLEDADHDKLKALVDRPIWGVFTRHQLQMIDEVKDAQPLPDVRALTPSKNSTTDLPEVK